MSTIGNQLDAVNLQLNNISGYIDAYVKKLEGKSQAYADEQMTILETDVEKKLNYVKDTKIVPPLHVQYENALASVAILKPLVEFQLSVDPQALLDALTLVIGIITAPYQPAADFIIEIAPKVIELADNIQTVATYQPTVEGIVIDPLDVNIGLTLQDIIDG